jgi:peroxiredoxin
MLGITRRIILLSVILIPALILAKDNHKKVADFTLKDYNGKTYTLSAFKDSKAVVIMFISTRCPVSNAYNQRMVKLYTDYLPKDVTFLAINANKQEDTKEIKEHADEHQFKFPILKDVGNKVADAYDAQVTPEIFVTNKDLDLLYHGRIDDSQRENGIEQQDLRNALDLILSAKEVKEKETKAFGCSIKRVD